jgi:hypothetical protein
LLVGGLGDIFHQQCRRAHPYLFTVKAGRLRGYEQKKKGYADPTTKRTHVYPPRALRGFSYTLPGAYNISMKTGILSTP